MSTGFDHLVAYHCAPTLMGHKAGSLFSMKRMAFTAQQEKAQLILAMLSQKGLSGQVIHCAGEATLVYLYRKERCLSILRTHFPAHCLTRMATPAAMRTNWWRSLRAVFRRTALFPMKSGCFWAIRRRMWKALLSTRDFIASTAAAGRCMVM